MAAMLSPTDAFNRASVQACVPCKSTEYESEFEHQKGSLILLLLLASHYVIQNTSSFEPAVQQKHHSLVVGQFFEGFLIPHTTTCATYVFRCMVYGVWMS